MRLIVWVLCSLSSAIWAAEERIIETSSGAEIEYIRFSEEDESARKVIIYIPGQRGLGYEYIKWSNDLVFDGIDVWALDLHSSYLLAKTRSSPLNFVVEDVVDVIAKAEKEYDKVYLLGVSRGAKFALDVAYTHQQQTTNHKLGGIILHSPHLVRGSADIGEEALYHKVAYHTNIPSYVIFSRYSTKYARAKEIADILSLGGSAVFTMLLDDTIAGFFMRKNSDLNARSIINKNTLPTTYKNALMLFDSITIPDQVVIDTQDTSSTVVTFQESLMPQQFPVRELVLEDLEGNSIDIAQYKNKVVLLNFWASWCTPCVKEIPSLMRLKEKVNNPDFEILAINIGESKERIQKFKKKVKFDLVTPLDTTGKYANIWNVYAYPSNYIVDGNSMVRYGYRGALEWDRADIIDTINALLDER